MKTRSEILESVEKLWEECQDRNKGSNESELDFKESVSNMIINHAQQCCNEQINACGERFKLLYGLKEDVKTILNTPNVVTTK